MLQKLLIIFTFSLQASTICLNMIVKDEKEVIERCLASVKKHIDYWVIVDTGSTDGTQQMIQNFMKDIPGELHERPWKDFAYNRNEALQLAKGKADYFLFIDADEVLEGSLSLKEKNLEKEYYLAVIRQKNICSQRPLLVNRLVDWKWEGKIHEAIFSPDAKNGALLPNCIIVADTDDGNRSKDPDKLLKDIALLENAFEEEPENSRYAFYLAQNYLNIDKYELALKYFEKRISFSNGNPQELFWSLCSIGYLQEMLQMPAETFIHSYCRAFQFSPNRAESLFRLASYYYGTGDYFLGYLLGKFALSIPFPDSASEGYIQKAIYDYGLHVAVAHCACGLKKYDEAIKIYQDLLTKNLPDSTRKEITAHLSEIKK